MKKNQVYTDEPVLFGEIMPDNFLPSPAEFRKTREAQEYVEVTLSLSKSVIDTVKKEARKKRSSHARDNLMPSSV